MISSIVSGIGAILAAVGGGVLLARCFRQPRGDLIAWAVALLGLLVSLGCQALGYLTGFDSAIFRGMELGGQVIAPLGAALALSELAARRTAVRFCARLYISALGLVALVVLATDTLSPATFTKAWPAPSVFYQLPPNYVLMFGVGPLTLLIAIIATGTVLSRSSQPNWNAVLRAELFGFAAAVALAYPCLAQLTTYLARIHVPIGSVFALACVAAAVLGWLAADRAGRVRLAVLHGRNAGAGAMRRAADGPGGRDAGDRGDRGDWGNGNAYRDDDLYRPDQPGRGGAWNGRGTDREADGYGWQDDRQGRGGSRDRWFRDEDQDERRDGYPAPGLAAGDFATGDFTPGDYTAGAAGNGGRAHEDFGSGEFATGDFAAADLAGGGLAAGASRLADRDGLDHRSGVQAPDSRRQYEQGAGLDGLPASRPRAGAEAGAAEMFGQIAIYTLIEDRVEEFDQLTERVVEQVRSREPDTLAFIVHAVPSAPMQRILYEVYRDRAAYQHHREQPYVRQFDADRRPFVLATNVIELGLQQAKVSPFPSVADLFGEPGYDTSGFERPDFLRDYGRTSGQAGTDRREFR